LKYFIDFFEEKLSTIVRSKEERKSEIKTVKIELPAERNREAKNSWKQINIFVFFFRKRIEKKYFFILHK
jgi:hypothetical protein